MSNPLVIHYRPWLEWLVGGLFIVGGLWPMFSGEPLFGGGFVLAGAAIILAVANTVTSRFDLTTKRFSQTTRGLVRHKHLTHPLDDITSVRVAQRSGSANSPSPTYTIVVVLRSGARVHIPSGTSSGKAAKEQLAAEIRRFLNLPDPGELPALGFRDLFRLIR